MSDTPELDFYLVQRLTQREMHTREGFDRLFSCQYMGASEFEWGAIPESLKRIRANKLGLHEGFVTREGITVPVFVVGHPDKIQAVPDALTAWMVQKYPEGKEHSYFPEAVTDNLPSYGRETHAWWSLRDDVMWALDPNVALKLIEAIQSGQDKKKRGLFKKRSKS